MNKTIISLMAAVGLSAPALADTAVYRDQSLSIKEALVVTDSGTSYYKDIKLTANPDGSFTLVQAVRVDPAHVDEVLVTVAGLPSSVEVNVEITGYLPNPCFMLEEPAVAREGTTFTIALAQTALQTFAACAQVIEPFALVVPLNVKGLPAGHYTVIVNGKQSGFDLPEHEPEQFP